MTSSITKIPKIIHYVWLGGAEMPETVKACLESWRQVMPDYEIRRWDEQSIVEIDSPFMRQAMQAGKWAFASDVIRLYALYRYGGIYLDTDVNVFRRFDALLDNEVFTGRENSIHLVGNRTINYVTTCCMGAMPGTEFIGRCLRYYDGRSFFTSTDESLPPELRYDMTLNSAVICRLAQEIGYLPSVLCNRMQRCSERLTVYPSEYFDPCGRTSESYCEHLALGTWRDREPQQWRYTLLYKVQWRLWRVVERVLRRFNRIIIKLN